MHLLHTLTPALSQARHIPLIGDDRAPSSRRSDAPWASP